MRTHLEEDGEHDHSQGGGDKHGGGRDDVSINHGHKGEADRSPQATIGHDELLLEVHLLQAPAVGEESQTIGSCIQSG